MQSLQIVLFLWFLFAPYYGAHPDVLVVLVNAVFDLSKLSHSEFTRMGPSQASWQGDHLSVAFTDGRSHLGGRSPISGHLSIIIPDPVMAFIRVSIVVIQAVLVWSTRGTALPFTNEQWWWWRCWCWWFSHAPLDLYWIPSQDVGGGGVTWPTSSSGSSSSGGLFWWSWWGGGWWMWGRTWRWWTIESQNCENVRQKMRMKTQIRS